MKEQSKNDSVASIREIYVKYLTDAQFSLADIIDPFICGIKHFSKFRGTLTKACAKTVQVLRKKIIGYNL